VRKVLETDWVSLPPRRVAPRPHLLGLDHIGIHRLAEVERAGGEPGDGQRRYGAGEGEDRLDGRHLSQRFEVQSPQQEPDDRARKGLERQVQQVEPHHQRQGDRADGGEEIGVRRQPQAAQAPERHRQNQPGKHEADQRDDAQHLENCLPIHVRLLLPPAIIPGRPRSCRFGGLKGGSRMFRIHHRLSALIALGAYLLAIPASAAPPWKKLSERETRYLEMELAQIRRLQSHFDWIGNQPMAAGALAAAALAGQDRPDSPRLREEAARWVTGVLDGCKKWHVNECARGQLPLERLVLEYPDSLPPALLARLRQAVSNASPPPGPGQIQNPWAFGDTENQRMIVMARSLVAHVVAGTPDSEDAQGWGAFAEAFLRAHDRDGWYEAESPGYLAISITALLQLADHAPQAAVRDLARRQLDVLFTTWAQNQVGGFPAGVKSRTNGTWALTPRSSPWEAWAWLAAGIGKPEDINFMDRPELPVSRYAIPESALRLLTGRRSKP